MIYTVTFNPALDYFLNISGLKLGETNRSLGEDIQLGGKGINVSVILSRLGEETTALGFIAGFTGEALENEVKKIGVKTDFIKLENGLTRINVKLKGDTETEINAQGPEISDSALNKLFSKLDKLTEEDTLVLAGSVPSTLPQNTYELILSRLENRGVRFCVDATGTLLLNVLKYKPFLVKPNNFELEEILGERLETEQDIINGAKQLREMGALNVLVSLGKDGALLVDEFGNLHRVKAHKIKPLNTVGAGDSMLAGFLVGAKTDYEYALKLGNAAGGATAASLQLAQKEEIFALL